MAHFYISVYKNKGFSFCIHITILAFIISKGNNFVQKKARLKMLTFFDLEDESDVGGLDGLPDHVGMMEKAENGRVYTIEGNTSDSCRQWSYSVGYYQILGDGITI